MIQLVPIPSSVIQHGGLLKKAIKPEIVYNYVIIVQIGMRINPKGWTTKLGDRLLCACPSIDTWLKHAKKENR